LGLPLTTVQREVTRLSGSGLIRERRAASLDLPVNISQRENKRRRGRLFFTSGEKFTC